MKKLFFLTLCFCSTFGFGQVGINTTNPASTFEIVGQPNNNIIADGLIVPRLTGDQLKAKDQVYENNNTTTKGAIVYVTDKVTTPSTITAEVIGPGYYYFDGVKWLSFASDRSKDKWFYAPSIALPTTENGVPTAANSGISYDASTEIFTIDLFSIYKKQFNVTDANINSSFVKSNPSSSLDSFDSDQLDYFIIYYDNSVYDPASIAVNTDGILTYKILATGIVTQNTYMNVVFKEK